LTTRVIAVAAAAAMGLAAIGCGSSSTNSGTSTGSSTGSSSGQPKKQITIGVSFDVVEPIRNAELKGIREEAAKAGAKVDFQQANNDPQTQASQIQDMIQTKKDDAIIAIAQNADQIVASIRLANQSKVPFIAIDRAPGQGAELTYQITGDPKADGALVGKYMNDTGKKLNALLLVGALTDANAIGRRDGFKEAVKGSSNVKIAAEVPTNWDPQQALSGTQNALQKDPSINAVFSPSDILLGAVHSALKSAGKRAADVTIVTIDGADNGCKAIQKKTLSADVATPVEQFGVKAVDAAIKAVNGQSVTPNVVQLPGVLLHQANFDAVSSQVWGCQVP
jgi:ABC-type sugar transport system substrate-binding protein